MNKHRTFGGDVIDVPRPRIYSAALQPLLQALMSTLANIDMEYERERQRLAGDPRDGPLKNRMLQKLHSHHQEKRRPYVEQLTIIQDRISQAAA